MVGIDMIQISRVAEKCGRESFMSGVFTGAERAYAESKRDKFEALAGIYAAKEAAAKALGTGIQGFRPADIEVLHDENGAPQILFHNAAKNLAAGKAACVSIAHDAGVAAAVVFLSVETKVFV